MDFVLALKHIKHIYLLNIFTWTICLLVRFFAKHMGVDTPTASIELYFMPVITFIYLIGVIGMGVVGGLKAIYEKDK